MTESDPPESPAASKAAGRPAPQGDTQRLYFYGSGATLFGIHIVNVLLTLLTLGIYYFWGKIRVRRYLMNQTELLGDRFAFHGTGKELLRGWLKAALVFGIPLLLLGILPPFLEAGPGVQSLAALGLYCLVQVFIPVAMVGARRYRLSRTSWRGIRFSFRGPAVEFLRIFIVGSLLSLLTVGLYYPFFEAQRYRFMTVNAYFGSRRFGFDGRSQDLLVLYLLAVLVAGVSILVTSVVVAAIAAVLAAAASALSPDSPLHALPVYVFLLPLFLPTLGAVWAWFSAKKLRYFWDHTVFGDARFRSTVTGRALFRLRLVNLVLLVLTLGLAWPWVTVRSARFAFRYLTLAGPLDLETIQQEAQEATAMGEGLSGFLDVGFDLG
jgi:uncharacterized membrane protein YjgN (DUF898 family)